MEIDLPQTSQVEIQIQAQEVIELLTSKIREGAQKAESLSSACIYRVPKEIRELNESAYTPRLIAIGPLHQNDPHLQTTMQDVKMSYMNNLLCRMPQGMKNQEAEQKKILAACVATMEMLIEDAKKCYAEEVSLDAEMMLVDGCFILEFLYKFYLCKIDDLQFKKQGDQDPIFAKGLSRTAVQYDLLLLENQIPFFVLEKLFTLTLAQIPNRPDMTLSLSDYVYLPIVDYIRPREGNSTSSGGAKTSYWPRNCVPCMPWHRNSEPEVELSNRNACFYHILHNLHNYFLPPNQTRNQESCDMPSASGLVYAGVKFVPGTGNDMFKVKFTEPKGPFWWFRSAHFEIPSFEVHDGTEPILRNFIAFEQCCPDVSEHFTSYAILMDMLVNDDNDVQVLEKAGIVFNSLGASKEVTDLLNKLNKEVFSPEFLYRDTCHRAGRYSKRFWPKNMASLRHQYFASPWKFIAFCFGIVYFVVTIAQLIVSIIK